MNNKNNFIFLEKTYKETVNMLQISRDYFVANGQRERNALGIQQSVLYTLAMSAITTQLTSTMGWLLACKAVQEGDISIEDLSKEKFRLQQCSLTIDCSDPVYAHLSSPILNMLQKSESLYKRVMRLEQSINDRILVEAEMA